MSSFLRKGKRQLVREQKKDVKKRTKDFYKILDELEQVYQKVQTEEYEDLREELNKDNLVELLQPLCEREIDSMERIVLMGKFGMYEDMDEEIKSVRRGEL